MQTSSRNGANDFLSKPCQEDELLRRMQAHLNLSYLYDDMDAGAARPTGSTRQVGERDVATSHALKDLADRYEYDALTHLLEEARL
jgi:DNA-binding response OmpR family regulator